MAVNNDNKTDIIHKSFEIGMLFKGINGILEIIGGVLFKFFDPKTLNKIIVLFTQHELSEDPNDFIAKVLISFGHNFNVNMQYFWAFYLLIHGVIKVITVTLLWKRKLWAYPIAIITFVLFIIYQIYDFTISHSTALILVTVFDIVMIILTFMEYKKMKNSLY